MTRTFQGFLTDFCKDYHDDVKQVEHVAKAAWDAAWAAATQRAAAIATEYGETFVADSILGDEHSSAEWTT